MKLTDKKFVSGRTTTERSSLSEDQKRSLRMALNNTIAAEQVFDKLAQIADVMAPQMGVAPPEKPKSLQPLHDGMWLPRQIKKHYRKLRSMGYGIDDADMAVSDVIREGGAGAGADDERVKDFLRRLWYATISTKPHEESLYRMATQLYAGMGGDTLSTEEIEGTGKIAADDEDELGISKDEAKQLLPDAMRTWLDIKKQAHEAAARARSLSEDNKINAQLINKLATIAETRIGEIDGVLHQFMQYNQNKYSYGKIFEEIMASVGPELQQKFLSIKERYNNPIEITEISPIKTAQIDDEATLWQDVVDMLTWIADTLSSDIEPMQVAAQAMPAPMGPAGAPQAPGTPPAAPPQQVSGQGMPGMDPMEMMDESDDMPLDEALKQLEEASRVVVEKVQQGETILNGENVEPSMPDDTGATPAPSPKIAGPNEEEPMDDFVQHDEGHPQSLKVTKSPEELLRDIEFNRWKKVIDTGDVLTQLEHAQSAPDKQLNPGSLKNLSKRQERKLIQDKIDKMPGIVKKINDPTSTQVNIGKSKLPLLKVLPTDSDEVRRMKQEYNDSIGSEGIDPDTFETYNALQGKRSDILKQIKNIRDLMSDEDIRDDVKFAAEKKINELMNELKSLDPNSVQEAPKGKDPFSRALRHHGPKYDQMKRMLTEKGFSPEEVQDQVDNVAAADMFLELMNTEVPTAGTGFKDIKKTIHETDDGKKYKKTPELPSRNMLNMKPGQDIMELAPDKGIRKAPVRWRDVLPPALPGIDNVGQYIFNLPKNDTGALDRSKLTPQDYENLKTMINYLREPHDFNKDQLLKGIQRSQKKDKSVGGTPTGPNGKATVDKDKMLEKARELMKQRLLNKKSVDQDAKEYYHEYYGDYGDQMSRDRVAEVVDAVSDIMDQYGISASNPRFAKIVAFIANDSCINVNSKYATIAKVASEDLGLAWIIDRTIANHLIRANVDTIFGDDMQSVKDSIAIVALHDAGIKDKVLQYVADKMKIPKPKVKSTDAIDVGELEDEAAKSEPTRQVAHTEFELDDMWTSGDYMHMIIKWDPDEYVNRKSPEGMMQAIRSYVKGLESLKELQNIGTLGKIKFEDFDQDAGVAEVMFMASKSGDAEPEVRTAQQYYTSPVIKYGPAQKSEPQLGFEIDVYDECPNCSKPDMREDGECRTCGYRLDVPPMRATGTFDNTK